MISSVQSLVLVGSYADPDQPGIHAFRFDDATRRLTPCGSWTGIDNPAFLVAHPHRPWLYAVSSTSQRNGDDAGSVWAIRFDADPLTFQPINHQSSGGDGPCHLQLDSSGNWLFVSNYGSGTFAVLPIRADGSLGEMTDVVQHHGRGTHPQRQEGPHAHSSVWTPDNRFVIVADLGLDQLLMYTFNAAAGTLTEQARVETRAGAGPRHMVFHPGGQQMYVANELDSTVSVYAYDARTGRLHERQALATIPPDLGENTVADIHISPSRQRVYVSNRGHNSLAVFDVATDGYLSRRAIRSCGGNWPRHFALASDDRYVLVANQYSGTVAVLPLINGPDEIGEVVGNVAVPQASCVHVVATKM